MTGVFDPQFEIHELRTEVVALQSNVARLAEMVGKLTEGALASRATPVDGQVNSAQHSDNA